MTAGETAFLLSIISRSMEKQNIKQRTARAILAKPIRVKIGNDSYTIARPTIRTLICVSEEISKLPEFRFEHGKELSGTIAFARHAKNIGLVLATLMLGVKPYYRPVSKAINTIRKKWLSEKLLTCYTPSELAIALTSLIMEMQIGDFFTITTSLNEINLIKTSKEVGTTASGR